MGLNMLNTQAQKHHILRICFGLATMLALFALLTSQAVAKPAPRDVEGIAAIVNDKVISLYDVDQRVRLFMVTSGIPETPETIDRLRGQVLRSLIDEKLQMQEAGDAEISIPKEAVDDSITRLAQQGNMNLEEILKFLKENDINENTLRSQIEAELAWSQYVRRRYGGRISVSETDIDEQYNRAIEAFDQPRFLISEILLSFDGFSDQARIQQVIEEIITQLKAGVDFGAIARQLSASATAARGGDVGWVYADQLDPNLRPVLNAMKPGQISNPVATPAGIYIIALRDRQEGGGKSPMRNQYDLLQILSSKDAGEAAIKNIASNFRTCKAAEESAKQAGATAKRTGLQPLGAFDAGLRAIVAPLEAGQLSDVLEADDKWVVFAVCDRKDDVGLAISRDAISDNIYSQRMSMMARRHLRDLRRDSVVEYR